MKLSTKFEKILREGVKKGAPIEDVRDALLNVVNKDHTNPPEDCELCNNRFRPYHKGRSWE